VLIHLYTASWNEELIIPFFLRHYEPLVDRIIVYDDDSTDRSLELLAACPKVEIRPLQRGAQSFLDAHHALFETCWHESRGQADWVCLADLDEFLFHPDWHLYLAAEKEAGITTIQANGYDMVSETFPLPGLDLPTTLTKGRRDFHLDKTSLFVPDAIDRINFTVGRHNCTPTGRIVSPEIRYLQLRHFKSLGLDYVLERNHALGGRLNQEDRARGWSTHYSRHDDSIRAEFLQQLAHAEPVSSPPRLPKRSQELPGKSWWQRRR